MTSLRNTAEKILAVGVGCLICYWLYRAIERLLPDASFAGVVLVLAVFFVGIIGGSAFFTIVQMMEARPQRRLAVEAVALAAVVLGLLLPAKLRADAVRRNTAPEAAHRTR